MYESEYEARGTYELQRNLYERARMYEVKRNKPYAPYEH